MGENLKVRAKALLVPFFKYSIFFWIVGSAYLLITKSETLMEALYCLRNFYAGCIWNRVIQNWFGWEYYSLGKRYFFLADFWFLIALFFSSVLFFLIVDRTASKVKTAVTVVILFVITGICKTAAIDLPYNIQLVPFWTALMLLGAASGREKLFEKPLFSGTSGWFVSLALLAAGVAVSMWKEPATNLFRGTFGSSEIAGMLLCILAAILIIPGLSGLCMLVEKTEKIRVKELSWLGSHSLLVYLYHMFFAWALCIITGFSMNYQEPASGEVMAGSILLILGSLGLVILRYAIIDRIAAIRKKE